MRLLILVVLLGALAAAANAFVLGKTYKYAVNPLESKYGRGCVAPCNCPWQNVPVAGSFSLTFSSQTDSTVDAINFLSGVAKLIGQGDIIWRSDLLGGSASLRLVDVSGPGANFSSFKGPVTKILPRGFLSFNLITSLPGCHQQSLFINSTLKA